MPESDGGQGGKLLDAVLVIEAVAQVCPTAGDCVQALNFGAIQQLARYGSPELKARYLAPCLRGERLITIAMTEPEAGSAVTDLRSRGRVEGDTVVLTGQKIFTTNGDTADYFVVWVRFGESSRTSGAILVERGAPGFTIDASHRFVSGERYGMLYFDECRVPRENILLPEDGFRKMLAVFNVERLGNASRSLALGQAAFELARDYAKERRQFGRRLAEFQGLQWRFAEMTLQLRSEEHTSELQSRQYLVCRLLLAKKQNAHPPYGVHESLSPLRTGTPRSGSSSAGEFLIAQHPPSCSP